MYLIRPMTWCVVCVFIPDGRLLRVSFELMHACGLGCMRPKFGHSYSPWLRTGECWRGAGRFRGRPGSQVNKTILNYILCSLQTQVIS